MPTVELTFDQVLQAVRELPETERQRLVNEVGANRSPKERRVLAKQLRRRFQADAKQQARLSDLLAKGNAGTLTAAESRGLDELVEDFECRTLAMAEELAAAYRMEVRDQPHA